MRSWIVEVEPARAASEDVPSASAVYRHKIAKDGYPTDAIPASVRSLFDLFEVACSKFPMNPCLGHRTDGSGPFVFRTYADIHKTVQLAASGLNALGVQPHQRIGFQGANSPEWMIGIQACNRMSFTCVPLYESIGPNAVQYILRHAEVAVALVSSQALPALVQAIADGANEAASTDAAAGNGAKPMLKAIVHWGPGHDDAVQAARRLGIRVLSWSELLELGADQPAEPVPPSPEDLATVMYTSGTTGDPKGVMLTHAALLAAVAAAATYTRACGAELTATDSFLSYLTLAHIMGRVNEEMFLSLGGSIGYWQGDPAKLVDDCAALRPTLFVGVPRVFDRVYARVMSQIASSGVIKRAVFHWAYARKLYALRQGVSFNKASPFGDRLVFSKVAEKLGGRVRAVLSGGAPLAPHVEDFLRVALCCPVVQGYGLTETCGASFIAILDDMKQAGTVGPPTPMTEFRLQSVPEMNYDALDPSQPKGEVLLRGPSLFSGYLAAPDKTAEVVDAQGWFHTGDIAELTPSGAIKIIDRKKNIFKLSQGEYVAVELLESVYKKAQCVDQVWVYGSSFESCLVAVVVPAMAHIKAWAAGQGIAAAAGKGEPDMQALLSDPRVNAYVLQELVAAGRASRLKGYEIVRGVHLEAEPFSDTNGLLTAAFKLKRPQLLQRYQALVDEMYRKANQQGEGAPAGKAPPGQVVAAAHKVAAA